MAKGSQQLPNLQYAAEALLELKDRDSDALRLTSAPVEIWLPDVVSFWIEHEVNSTVWMPTEIGPVLCLRGHSGIREG
eukprot:1405519-Amphidinium_carterae.1